MSGPERRKYDRKLVTLQVDAQTSQGHVTFYTSNMSRGGVYLNADEPSPPGTVMDLVLNLSGREVKVKGEIRWSREASNDRPAGMGVQIIEISEEDQKILDEFLSRL
jgi:type IV pilus assembly protein PilZ